jgi:hypothetical protein
VAAATTSKPPGLSAAKQRFAYIVSRGTGLDWRVVEAWILVENGPDNNPLNAVPGKDYGSPDKAAAATITALRDSRYRPVINATEGSATDQLAAIARSPWNDPKAPGSLSQSGYLTALKGTYRMLAGAPAPKISGSHSEAFPGASFVAGAADAAVGDTSLAGSETGAAGWVGEIEHFVVSESVLALAYLGLTIAALAFIVLGAARTSGYTPGQRSSGGGGGEIPF